jgi:hypothetical protein
MSEREVCEMAFEPLFEGLCPECLAKNEMQVLWLNTGDVFECPRCHLQVSLASGMRATICRRRGRGEFRSLDDVQYCAKRHARGLLLARESPSRQYEADGFNVIKDAHELIDYLHEVRGVD